MAAGPDEGKRVRPDKLVLQLLVVVGVLALSLLLLLLVLKKAVHTDTNEYQTLYAVLELVFVEGKGWRIRGRGKLRPDR